jgi:uncharacterized protein
MASGLAALLDDVAAIAKVAASSIDDIGAAAGRASTKAAGVVIDDTAVTPAYVTGFTPDRELPIIGRIALGSLRNKLLILLPAALLLSAFLPWAITPLLMLGGAFLCFEGAEKALEAFGAHGDHGIAEADVGDPAHLEQQKVSGAIRTDLILSAEIMAIALADVAATPLVTQAITLLVVSLLVTGAVYGVVALIVKMDDIGLHLAREARTSAGRSFGRLLVQGMPAVLAFLSTVGMAAMLWVGGGIILHGMEHFGFAALPHLVHVASGAVTAMVGGVGAVLGWLTGAALSGVFGLALGLVIVSALHLITRMRGKAH